MKSAALLPALVLAFASLGGAVAVGAVQPAGIETVEDTVRAMARARAEGASARARAEKLEAQARQVTAQADRTASEAAAIAARIQQTQAQVAVQEAQGRMIAHEQERLRTRLAARQQPLVRLTAALQRLSRRPPLLAILRPGSIRDTMHARALLATILPQVERRTAALRADIARARQLQARARQAATALRATEASLVVQRRRLAQIESGQRIASRQAISTADREAERALALAEQASDLGALVRDLGEAGRLRAALARLPGPILRPERPDQARVMDSALANASDAAPRGYMLPVAGRLLSGFGAAEGGAARSRGISLATRPAAQVVSPGPGRIAFAGPFRGFGRIVIVEHDGGWTSLVTGMADLDTRVGERVVAGSPLGVTGAGTPVVTLELRRNGEPVNPLQFIAVL